MSSSAMQTSFVIQFTRAVLKEAVHFKTWVVLIFAMVSLVVLGIGLVYPKQYTASTTIHADQQNIIKPLLEGQATTTRVSDKAGYVEEIIKSPRLLYQLVEELNLDEQSGSEREVEFLVRALMPRFKVDNIGSSFVKVQYRGNDPNEVYNVASKITDLFIKDSSESKRKESRGAYLFIDKQAKAYKDQLKEAEQRLKKFNSSNYDGTEASAKQRIASLRSKIEGNQLEIEESQIRINSLEKELVSESQYVASRFRADEYRNRLATMQSKLDSLRLTYTEGYPDIVALKQQIQDLRQSISMAEGGTGSSLSNNQSKSSSNANINPLYEELRTRVATEKVEVNTKKRRLQRNEKLLNDEYERLERIAARQADLAELTRDYDVTKSIYEDMLARKERARLSMTLDIEGQGVTYRIQEPASFPLSPDGIKFMQFVLLGPLIGLMVPIGLLVLYVQFDPRIRFTETVENMTEIPILGVVPHVATPLTKRMFRSDAILLSVFIAVVMCIYISIVVARNSGVI